MPSKSQIPPRLVVIEGKEKGKVIPLKAGTVVIGRSKGDVLVSDPRISRSHVAIHYDEKTGKLTFTDLKSLNGTLINGDPVQRGDLSDGDKIQLGNTTFDCQISPEEADKTELAERPVAKKKRTEERKKTVPKEAEIVLQTDISVLATDEPSLRPLAEESRVEPNAVEHWSEDEVSEQIERTNHSFTPIIKRWYHRVPPMVRNATLGLILVGFGLSYLGNNAPPDPKQLENELSQVKRLGAEEKWTEATDLGKKIAEEYPDHSAPWMILGDIFSAQGNLEQAIGAFRQATELKPEQPVAHTRLLKLYSKTGLWDKANEQLVVVDKMLRDGPYTKQLFSEAAQIFLEHKELKQPVEKVLILAKALQNSIATDSSVGYRIEAQAHFAGNRAQDAADALSKGLKISPNDEWLLENLTFARLTLNDSEGAVRTVEQWIQYQPSSTKPLLVMGYLKFNAKNFLGALPYVQKIVQISAANPRDPHYAEALNLVGQIYMNQNQLTEAETFLKQACQLGYTRSCTNDLVQKKTPASVPNDGAESVTPNQPVQPAQPAAPSRQE